MRIVASFIVTLTAAGSVLASAPETSPRPPFKTYLPITAPVVRPGPAELLGAVAPATSFRPALRGATRLANGEQLEASTASNSEAIQASSGLGRLCGAPDIRGEQLMSITGKVSGCGIADPVRVHSVAGVSLLPAAIMDCTTARALSEWTKSGAKPAFGRLGRGLSSYTVAASYACRTRNNQPGGPLSRHASGQAVDIRAFGLKNGVTLGVKDGWRNSIEKPVLSRAQQSACSHFRVVLGPNSDAFHQDHIHLDSARRSSRKRC